MYLQWKSVAKYSTVKFPLIAFMNVVDCSFTVIYINGRIVSINKLQNNAVPLFLWQTWMSVLGRMEVASMSVLTRLGATAVSVAAALCCTPINTTAKKVWLYITLPVILVLENISDL